MAGRPPKRSLLVGAWANLHETELEDNCYPVNNNGECLEIVPLHEEETTMAWTIQPAHGWEAGR